MLGKSIGLESVEVLRVESKGIIGILECVSTTEFGGVAWYPVLHHLIDSVDLKKILGTKKKKIVDTSLFVGVRIALPSNHPGLVMLVSRSGKINFQNFFMDSSSCQLSVGVLGTISVTISPGIRTASSLVEPLPMLSVFTVRLYSRLPRLDSSQKKMRMSGYSRAQRVPPY